MKHRQGPGEALHLSGLPRSGRPPRRGLCAEDKQGDKALRESGLAFLFPAWTRIFSLLLLGNQCCNHLFQTESVSREGMHFPTQKENACLHPICPVSAEVIHYTLCRVSRGKTFYPHNFLHSKSSSQWVLIFTSWKLGFHERKQ